MLARFLVAGHRAAWVAGDEVYDGAPSCAARWRNAAPATSSRWPARTKPPPARGSSARTLWQKSVPKRAWQNLSAGTGAKGHRFDDWAVIDLANLDSSNRQRLIRRSRGTGERADYRCYSPTPVPLTELVRVTGPRWRAEGFFQSGKSLADWTSRSDFSSKGSRFWRQW